MICYIKGIITEKKEDCIVVECNNMGYQIAVSSTTLSELEESQEVCIYTFLSVKEDNIALFGFLTQQEQNLFHKLLTVSGIGPKGALAFLSTFSPDEIVTAILSEDVKTLSKAQGIGKKTAQRMILELKDKVHQQNNPLQQENSEKWEAIEALTALGYSRSEAMQAVSACYQTGLTVEQTLKLSLKKLIK